MHVAIVAVLFALVENLAVLGNVGVVEVVAAVEAAAGVYVAALEGQVFEVDALVGGAVKHGLVVVAGLDAHVGLLLH